MSPDESIGQKLMIGIPGPEATPALLRHFRDLRPGGLIIFRRNFRSAAQFRKLVSDLEKTLGYRLILAVDHEGGRVIHLSEGITVFPDNFALGKGANENYAAEQGLIEAKELRRLGFDLNLAPTVDVLGDQFSPNIGIRSYGKDPKLVSRLGGARICGMQENGLSACAKHFPGQGQSAWDAHEELPVLDTSQEEIRKRHLMPFAVAIQAGVDALMSSHPVYPSLDEAGSPATFSRKIIHELLRREMNFQGLILSDDLEMGSLKKICPVEEAAVRAVIAGHDMVLICSDLGAQKKAHQSLVQAYHDGKLDTCELETSRERITAFQKKRELRFESGEVLPERGGAELAQEIAEKGIEMSGMGFLSSPAHDPLIIFPRLGELRGRIFIEKQIEDFPGKVFSVGLSPSDQEIEEGLRLAKVASGTWFFCYDARLDKKTEVLLKRLQDEAHGLVVFLMRDPYDRELLREGIPCILTYGFRNCQIRAALSVFIPTKSR